MNLTRPLAQSNIDIDMANIELKRVRESRSMSRNKLARLTGLAPQTIYSLEQVGTTPGLDTARRIADALGVSVDEIFPIPSNETEAVNQ